MGDFRLLKYRPLAYHHVTFATTRRKKIIAGEIRDRVHYWFERIAAEYNIQLEERNTWLDHAHLLIYVGYGEDLSYMLNVLKGVSARRVFQEFPELKMQIGENHLGVFQMSWLEVQRTCLDAKRKHFPVFWNVLRAPKCVAPFRLN